MCLKISARAQTYLTSLILAITDSYIHRYVVQIAGKEMFISAYPSLGPNWDVGILKTTGMGPRPDYMMWAPSPWRADLAQGVCGTTGCMHCTLQ